MSDLSRRHWMTVLARSDEGELSAASAGLLPSYSVLRGPEAGLIMLRGRTGGNGSAFNLGEASAVRCTVRSQAGYIGHAYCLGRELRFAELAAAIDAGLQDPLNNMALYQAIILPLEGKQKDVREQLARRAAATQVQFFTMSAMRT